MPDRNAAILAPEFAALPDWQVADALNVQARQVDGDSPIVIVQNYLVMIGQWGRMKDDAEHHADTDRRVFLLNALCLFEDPKVESLGWGDDPSYPIAIEAILDGMMRYGYLDAVGKSFVMSQRYVSVPVWDPPITNVDVNRARGIPAVIQE